MGFLGGLFSRSNDRDAAKDRCMECGMAGGSHTEWCPADAEAEATPGPPTPETPSEPDEQQPTA